MRTPRRLRALLPLLALALGTGLPLGCARAEEPPATDVSATAVPSAASPAASPTPAAAGGPVGGTRLAEPGVVTDGAVAPPEVTAASYVVADLDTGAVMAAKDAHGRYAPASTLKTLTALALIPRLDPAALVTPTRADVDVDGSKVGLVTQLPYSVKDLFTAMLVVSGNDAAGALATAVGGQQVATALMNDEAARLQAHDTHAVNPSGLDAEGQLSSAYDLALIARAGMRLPDFRAYVAVRRSTIPAPDGQTIEIDNHNRLLGTYDGALGIKNGFTEAARASYVGAATRGGHTLVVSLMRADPAFWKEATGLLDWGFAAATSGSRPVGRLVDPLVAAAPMPSASADSSRVEVRAAVRPAPDQGRSLLVPVALATTLLVGLGLLRRRAVVRSRARRRSRARAAPGGPRASRRGTGPPARPPERHSGPAAERHTRSRSARSE